MHEMKTTGFTAPSRQRIADLRASLVSIVEVCPLEICNSEECPLYAFRSMSHAERVRMFDEMDREDLIQLAAFHHTYLNFKMSRELHQVPT